jgi:hypothetical protein
LPTKEAAPGGAEARAWGKIFMLGNIPIPWRQFLMIALFVRKNKTCTEGWTKAGRTRRMVTALWGTTLVVHGGMELARAGKLGFTDHDVVPGGFDMLTSEDMGRFNDQIEAWLDYWSSEHPGDTLHTAMLNMLGRLLKIKRHWTESGQHGEFPFARALEEVRTDRFEALMQGARV